MRYAPFIKENGTIELVAPSFGCTTEPYKTRLKYSIKYFKDNGYKIKKNKLVYSEGLASSGTPKARANEFINAYKSFDSNIIWSVGGGEIMFDILNHINFEDIKNANPKLFIGYSDNTNLTFLLTTICDVASVYGMCFPDFGSRELHQQHYDMLSLVTNKSLEFTSYKKYERKSKKHIDYLVPLNLTRKVKINELNDRKCINVQGRIIGGCFDILTLICGTKYDNVENFINKYKDDGFIWYLDSCDFNSLYFYRSLLQLSYAGWFKYVKCFLIGRVANTNEPMNFKFVDALHRVLDQYNVPVLYDVDIGHVPPSMPILNGSIANITFSKNILNIKYTLK